MAWEDPLRVIFLFGSNSKSECRNPKQTRNPKPYFRNTTLAFQFRDPDLLRISKFELRISRSRGSFLIAQRVDGVAHLFISAAAADVALQAVFDFGGRGLGILFEDGLHSHDEPGRAEAALLRVVLHERGR